MVSSINQIFNIVPTKIFSQDDLAGNNAGIMVYWGQEIKEGNAIFYPKNSDADISSGREAVLALAVSPHIDTAQIMVDDAVENGNGKSRLKLSFNGMEKTNVSGVCPNIALENCANGNLAKHIATLFGRKPL